MYTTLSELKNSIGIPVVDTMNDPYLYKLIETVTALIDKYIGVSLVYKTNTNILISGNNSQRIRLPALPVNSITSLYINDEDVTSECSIEDLNTVYREAGFNKILYVGASDVVAPNYTKKNIKTTFVSGYVMPIDCPYISMTITNSGGDALFTSAGNTLTTNTPIRIFGSLPNNIQSMKTYYVEVITAGSTFKIKPASGVSTPVLYVSAGISIQYQVVDTAVTLPTDIQYIANKVCERLFTSKNKALNIVSQSADYGSSRTSETFKLLANSIFTDQERYVLDQYKQVN